jgi:hypothetical protein
MMERQTVLKNVELYFKNKFEKLVHLVGFIIRIYHDARFSECQASSIVVPYGHRNPTTHETLYSVDLSCY